MSEWRERPLGDLIDLHDSKRVPLSGAQRQTRQGPYPYYGAQSVIDHIDDFIFDGRYILIPEDGENLNSRKLPIAYFAEGKFWVNNHAHIAKAKPGVAVDRFVQSALESTDISGFVTGAAQPKLSQANLLRIPILAPEPATQERICSVLDAIDDLIENNRRRVELLEQMAQAIYREWFVHFRYPGHEHDELVDSPLGPIPSGWRTTTLGTAVELAYGKALKADERKGGDVVVVGSSGVVGSHDRSVVDGPAIVVGRKGNVGSVIWVGQACWPIDTTYFVRTSLPMRFVYRQLQTVEFINSHAAVPGLSREQAYAADWLVPAVPLMERYESLAADLGDAAGRLLEVADLLVEIRDLLLPRLVTGKIDVSKLDLDAVLEGAGV